MFPGRVLMVVMIRPLLPMAWDLYDGTASSAFPFYPHGHAQCPRPERGLALDAVVQLLLTYLSVPITEPRQ